MTTIQIGSNRIGDKMPCFIIAEGGLNHNGDMNLAKKMIHSAAQAGADAIKFQTFTTEELFPPNHPDYAQFQKTLFDRDTYLQLQQEARQQGLVFLSTPFDKDSVDLLDEIGVPAFKIGSGEVTHVELLEYIATKGKPILLSTGMSQWEQIDRAVKTIRKHENPLILLHCVSAYPCPIEEAQIRTMTAIRERYGLLVGYSDHTEGDEAALAAVALGGCVVEKHFTLSQDLPGWDHFFSYDPDQMRHLIHSIRLVEACLGDDQKGLTQKEQEIQSIARRALYARRYIRAGEVLNHENVVVRRPEGPIPADQWPLAAGKKAAKDIPSETPLTWDQIGNV